MTAQNITVIRFCYIAIIAFLVGALFSSYLLPKPRQETYISSLKNDIQKKDEMIQYLLNEQQKNKQ